MQYFVNDNCIGCGLCASICPEVFEMTDTGMAQAAEQDVSSESAEEAMQGCPVNAIEHK